MERLPCRGKEKTWDLVSGNVWKLLVEQELDGAERGLAGQCGPGWEAETCP